MISLNSVSFSYLSPVLVDINYNFDKGVFFITGKNGVGKSTLLKIIMGLIKPLCGDVFIEHENLKHKTLGETGRLIGYLSSEVTYQLFASCVYDEIFFPLEFIGKTKEQAENLTIQALKTYRLVDILDRSPLKLSCGEKKRLLLACISTIDPPYLVFDEPTASLDKQNRDFLMDYIKEQSLNKTIIIATHDYDLIEKVKGKVLEIDKGKLYET